MISPRKTPGPIKILIVDDSSVFRQALSDHLSKEPAISGIVTASDGRFALRKIERLDPDVVTLDVEMPGMDGLATLDQIMRYFPRPVIMISSHTSLGAEKTIQALILGAVDFIQKPGGSNSLDITDICSELMAKVLAVVTPRPSGTAVRGTPLRPSPVVPAPSFLGPRPTGPRHCEVVAIGASTGGPEATHRILTQLPADFGAGIVVVQHMPEGFTRSYASRLDQLCRLEIKEAEHHDVVRPGRVLIAAGHSHITLRRSDLATYVELYSGPRHNGHRPSVDMLFESVARECGSSSIGVLLTGMGRDGAEGLRKMKEAGATTIAQDEESCVVYGMPRAAVEMEAADMILPLSGIARSLLRSCSK